ncbi:MAG: hypothetical protein Kow00121_62070 [Elainellaceae cyanobacterium]
MQRLRSPWLLGGIGLIAMAAWLQSIHPSFFSSGSSDSEVTLTGKALEGTTIAISDVQGQPLTLTIAEVELDPTDPEQEVYLYTLLYQDSTSSQWQHFCPPDREGSVQAIPLSGQWDAAGNHIDNGEITFACSNSILTKCVRLGYKPWKVVNGQSLRDYHQACTRMMRADYCGNGISHTQEGTPIDVYDRLGIQQPDSDSGMAFEAAWSPEGAVWLSRTRYPEAIAQLQQECPEKLQAILHSADESAIASDVELYGSEALIVNRSFLR